MSITSDIVTYRTLVAAGCLAALWALEGVAPIHHSNVRLPAGVDRALRVVIPTPWMHWVHHSQIAAERDSNYSSLLSVRDRLFGTFRLRERLEEIRLGLPEYPEAEWRRVIGMLRAPFKRRRNAMRFGNASVECEQ